MEFFQSLLMPVETRPKESTSAGDWSFSLNDHADFAPSCPDIALLPTGADWASPAASEQNGETSAVDCSFFLNDHAGFAQSCPGTTFLPTGADWASPAASEQYGGISYGSCTSGMEGDTSIYLSPEPSSAPTASSAALIPSRCSGAEWASPVMLPLRGWRNPLC
jgi:hypothetical protein